MNNPGYGAWLAALGAGLYLIAVPNDWVLDDRLVVFQNPLVRDPSRFLEIFTTDYWHFLTKAALYRPVTVASMALEHAIAGDAPWSYRLVNAILHGLAVWLLFALLRRRLALAPQAATLGALLFALHPAGSEAVLQLVGRADVFVAIATLAILHLHLSDYRVGRLGRPAGVAAATGILLLALGSKESAVAIPPILLAVDVARRAVGRHLPVHAAAVATTLAFWFGVRGPVLAGIVDHPPLLENPLWPLAAADRLGGALGVIGRYGRILLFPVALSADYSFDAVPARPALADAHVVAGILLLAASIAGFARASRRRHEAAALGLALVWMPLVPVSNVLVPIGTILAERFLYLPAAGLAVLAACLLERVPRAWPVAILVAAALGVRTGIRERDWRDEATLYARTASGSRSAKAHFHHGLSLHLAGRAEEAEAAYRRALEIRPGDFQSHFRLGLLHREQGRLAAAEAALRQAIAAGVAEAAPHVQLGEILKDTRRREEALECFERAIAIDAGSFEAWYGMGATLVALGNLPRARSAFQRAVEANPASPHAQAGLANVQLRTGEVSPGRLAETFRELAVKHPQFAPAWFGLGECLWILGRRPEAIEALRRAAEIAPGEPAYRLRLEEALRGS